MSNPLFALIEKDEPDDAIWQAAIDLSEHIPDDHAFVLHQTLEATQAASHADTFAAIACCLLEHLLEHDFAAFDQIETDVQRGNTKLLYALAYARKMGCSKLPDNAARWDALTKRYSRRLRQFENRLRAQGRAECVQTNPSCLDRFRDEHTVRSAGE
jgi:hypothetical protein